VNKLRGYKRNPLAKFRIAFAKNRSRIQYFTDERSVLLSACLKPVFVPSGVFLAIA
jgi:hypothetical protein